MVVKSTAFFSLIFTIAITYTSCTKQAIASDLAGKKWKVTAVSGTCRVLDPMNWADSIPNGYVFTDSVFTMSQLSLDTFGFSTMMFDFIKSSGTTYDYGGGGVLHILNTQHGFDWVIRHEHHKKYIDIGYKAVVGNKTYYPSANMFESSNFSDDAEGRALTIVKSSENKQEWEVQIEVIIKDPLQPSSYSYNVYNLALQLEALPYY